MCACVCVCVCVRARDCACVPLCVCWQECGVGCNVGKAITCGEGGSTVGQALGQEAAGGDARVHVHVCMRVSLKVCRASFHVHGEAVAAGVLAECTSPSHHTGNGALVHMCMK